VAHDGEPLDVQPGCVASERDVIEPGCGVHEGVRPRSGLVVDVPHGEAVHGQRSRHVVLQVPVVAGLPEPSVHQHHHRQAIAMGGKEPLPLLERACAVAFD
jgi:hypothetical protein